MKDLLPELCDQFEDQVRVVEPMFANFGAKECFSGQESIKIIMFCI